MISADQYKISDAAVVYQIATFAVGQPDANGDTPHVDVVVYDCDREPVAVKRFDGQSFYSPDATKPVTDWFADVTVCLLDCDAPVPDGTTLLVD